MNVLCVTSTLSCNLSVQCTLCMYYFFVLLLQDGWTALHCAASNNHPEIIKILITEGADITAVDEV